MKTRLLILLLCPAGFGVFAQVGINATGASPHASAMLDVSSSTKGLLPPRMTDAERDAIVNPAEGLRIYNTDTKCENYFDGAVWLQLCGSSLITPFSCGDTITDARDGNTYGTTQIGSQCWMAKNLAYLPAVTGPSTGSNSLAYYYVMNYNGADVPTAKASSEYNTYGVLYNWAAAMAGAGSSNANPSNVQGICMTGWHLPSETEWCQLESFLGISNPCATTSWRGSSQGTELKTSAWGGTDNWGFAALPGGYRSSGGSFGNFSTHDYFWSTTEGSATEAWWRGLNVGMGGINRSVLDKESGFSIRCVKD